MTYDEAGLSEIMLKQIYRGLLRSMSMRLRQSCLKASIGFLRLNMAIT